MTPLDALAVSTPIPVVVVATPVAATLTGLTPAQQFYLALVGLFIPVVMTFLQGRKTAEKVVETHAAVNSRMDQFQSKLIEATEKAIAAAHAAGKAEGMVTGREEVYRGRDEAKKGNPSES